MGVSTDWKSLRAFIFMDLKKPLSGLKSKVKIKENLSETLEHCLK